MIGGLGTQEILLILLAILILFGAKRIPEIMRGFGQGLREFKSASQKAMDEIDQATSVDPTPTRTTSSRAPETTPMPEDSPKVEPE